MLQKNEEVLNQMYQAVTVPIIKKRHDRTYESTVRM